MRNILKEGAKIRLNYKNKSDGIQLLQQIKDDSLRVVFFDPQYRGVLDKLQYGNEGTGRGHDRASLEQMPEEKIIEFLTEIERVLLPSGYLFLWVDKFHLVSGVMPWFEKIPSIDAVDMIVWDKQKIGMGYRTRRKCEYLIVLQKEPRKARDTWHLHNIPDVWPEKVEKLHPHSKPVGLQEALISATTSEQDFICDPASGGYSVMRACEHIGRNFIGGDIAYGEN